MKAWETFLLEQEKELGEATVKKWLRTLKVVRYDAQNLFLEASDSFQALWFEEHIRKKLLQGFYNNNFQKIRVHLSLANKYEQLKKKESKPAKLEPPKFSPNFDSINPLFTFSNYVVTPANEISIKILTEPNQFNPIYLYGPSGSGKTHLLMALTQQLGAQGLKVTYARTETFTEHVVSAIRASEMGLFREAYRNIDVLILDDVHELAHKGATQEELFHTFNTLHLAGKPIILASQMAPSELQHIEPRLVSRFEWGISLPLAAPTIEEMPLILDRKCQAFKYPLHRKTIDFLVQTFKSGPKAIIQALEALILRTHLQNSNPTTLTIPLVKHYLSDLIQKEEEIKLTPQKIIYAVAEHYGIRAEDILGVSQTRESTLPRQLAMFLCREELKLPFKKIGDIFERDHSTVMTSIKVIKNNPEAMAAAEPIIKKISF